MKIMSIVCGMSFLCACEHEDETVLDSYTDSVEMQARKMCRRSSYIKTSVLSTVYFVDADDVRHAFVMSNQYFTWEDSFSIVKTVTVKKIASIPLGCNMVARPGVVMVKIQSDPKVYWLEATDDLCVNNARFIYSEAVAEDMIGPDWADYIIDIPDFAFTDYDLGDPIYDASEVVVDKSIMKKRWDLHE